MCITPFNSHNHPFSGSYDVPDFSGRETEAQGCEATGPRLQCQVVAEAGLRPGRLTQRPLPPALPPPAVPVRGHPGDSGA